MTITIYHNPDCGTSRNTLAMIRQSGEEPEVIEYLKNPPSRESASSAAVSSGRTSALSGVPPTTCHDPAASGASTKTSCDSSVMTYRWPLGCRRRWRGGVR